MNIEGVNLQTLADWMDQKELGDGPLENARLLAGGTQNILMGFSRSGQDYVLRRPPLHPRSNSNKTMRREARVLGAIADSEVPHPGLIADCPEEDVLGVSFYLMEPIDGFNPVATNPLEGEYGTNPVWRHQMGMELIDGIARLGAIDYLDVGLDGFGKPENYLERQVDRWASQLASYEALQGWPGASGLPGVADIGKWLSERVPGNYRAGVIHGDYHMGNVMFSYDAPKLAAIVDWELSTIGDPLIDLGWLMATWPINGELSVETVCTEPWDGFPEIDELVERYAAQSDRDVSDAQWYGVLGCYKLGILLEGTYARACAGKASKETGDNLHASAVGLFNRALNWINA